MPHEPCDLCQREERGFRFRDPERISAKTMSYCSWDCARYHSDAEKAHAIIRINRPAAKWDAGKLLGAALAPIGYDVRTLTRDDLQPTLLGFLADYADHIRNQCDLPPRRRNFTGAEADGMWRGWVEAVGLLQEWNQPILTSLTKEQWDGFLSALISGYVDHLSELAKEPPF